MSLARVLADPADARQRAALLQTLRSAGDLAAVQAVVTRAAKLATKGELPKSVLSAQTVVDNSLFEKASEAAMLAVLNGLEPIATGSDRDRYSQLAQGLIAGSSALANFFDGDDSVMVMAEDPAVRTNRLNLLGFSTIRLRFWPTSAASVAEAQVLACEEPSGQSVTTLNRSLERNQPLSRRDFSLAPFRQSSNARAFGN